MKKLLLLGLVMLSARAMSQFKSASLQAAGLTCAMCSRAVNKSLEKLPFVQSVEPELKTSTFRIVFRDDKDPDFDAIRNAVQEAGFSVAKLNVQTEFHNLKVEKDAHITIDGKVFHFINASSQVLNGEKTISFADKDFLTQKEFRKYASATQMKCFQTGKAAACCTKEGVAANSRIYHITI